MAGLSITKTKKEKKIMVKYFLRFLCFCLFCFHFFTLSADEKNKTEKIENYPIKKPLKQNWSFQGPFGIYDQQQLRRGFQVYYQNCATCHSLNFLSFRDLKQIGFTEKELDEIIKKFQIYDGIDEDYVPSMRPAKKSDFFPAPYANKKIAASMNNGVVPPDLSLMTRARSLPNEGLSFLWNFISNYNEGGADYIASLLSGYEEPPSFMKISQGQYYNPYYLSGQTLSMPQMLFDGQIKYQDDTDETVEQYAKDVAAFLNWVGDPHLEKRKKIGFCVLLFLIVFSFLLYFLKNEFFKDLEKEK